MTATHLYTSGRVWRFTRAAGYLPVGTLECQREKIGARPAKQQVAPIATMLLAGVLCNDTELTYPPATEGEDSFDAASAAANVKITGSLTEAALIVAARKIGLVKGEADQAFPRLAEVPFNSARKIMLTLHANNAWQPTTQQQLPNFHDEESKVRPEADSSVLVHLPPPSPTSAANDAVSQAVGQLVAAPAFAAVKGAPRYVLAGCTHQLGSDGQVVPLVESDVTKMLETVDEFATQAMRVLAVAYKPCASLPDEALLALSADAKLEQLARGCVFLGFIGIVDPPRVGIKEAIETAAEAGVKTVMITGQRASERAATGCVAKVFRSVLTLVAGSALVIHQATTCSRRRPLQNQSA